MIRNIISNKRVASSNNTLSTYCDLGVRSTRYRIVDAQIAAYINCQATTGNDSTNSR